jgi:hypothetical protein
MPTETHADMQTDTHVLERRRAGGDRRREETQGERQRGDDEIYMCVLRVCVCV